MRLLVRLGCFGVLLTARRRGPDFASVDARWSHEFAFGSGKGDHPSMMVGVDAFNLLNHVNFAGYVGNLRSPFFGRPIAALPARRVQFSAGVSF